MKTDLYNHPDYYIMDELLNAVEKKIDQVFSNMKKRNSNTNFQIDYPWLTI